jgi:hypothetical protein
VNDVGKDASRKRPGPIHFQAEAQVTSKKIPEAPNEGGVGTASTLRLETPKGSRRLKVAGPWAWFFFGFILFLLGLFFHFFISLFGVVLCITSILVNRNNKTQRRLRS